MTTIFHSVSEWRKWKMIDMSQTGQDIVIVFEHMLSQDQLFKTSNV